MTSSESVAVLAAAIEQCAKEPIHTPGSIQPQGFMLVLQPGTFTVLQASDNLSHWLGVGAQQVLGQALGSLLAEGGSLLSQLAALADGDKHPVHAGDVRFSYAAQRTFAVMAHSHDGVVFAEFEPASDVAGAYGHLYPFVRTFVGQTQEMGDLTELCQLAVQEIKRITGFGRVKAYRFDTDGNGWVLAEQADPGYPSFLGLWFPAADIPAQARELYVANRIRVIEDANYRPSALVPPLNPLTGRPLDMSHAALRSVSPVHLQYMRNMGTLASMSLSIVVRGRLWGLVSCHNQAPRAVGFQARMACELLGSVLSLQIEARETDANTQRLLGLRQSIVRMLSAMADRDSVPEGLKALPDTLIGFAGAQGAAVYSESSCELFGTTPGTDQVEALALWLSSRSLGTQQVFHSDNVGRDIPELPRLAESIAGVLAVAISELHNHYLVWFRVEQRRTVTWAGRPEKEWAGGTVLNPRSSFEQWQETVSGHCRAWEPMIIEGALELRMAVLGIVLRKAEEVAQLARDLKKSNKELEAFSYSVSHDLRAPLRHIVGYAELLNDFERSNLSERGLRFLEHIGESARFAGTLVDNLLSFSQMGRSALRLSDVDLGALVDATRRELAPDYAGREVAWQIEPLPRVIADAAFIHLALRNLLANAIKYTRDRAPAVIRIGAQQQGAEVIVYVKDNGVGFDMAYAGKLFGVFQRLHRMEEFEGTGIGLASVRRIIERHEGRVWAEGVLGEGATFYFALPKRD
ncbi:ATP-binding protein [Pseudomonas typographi]|uniref:histidine kinase n=1 Tax=Pseudomonas typographi TaxID=2715964 RepID=A0ABR7Z752_9PSED|nr:ATP-binding protein [Pseudomonas typographi]MBD1553993.1 GAF domain-containing protein [Pseudomonas typographi]MBD1589262.1 GAF domain-containing protein [Pseudomonas typographi]MBD1601290.1 GAF domain-containing protein [Pseudomonas typographi]